MTFSFAFGEPGENPVDSLDTAVPVLRGEPRESLLGAPARQGGDSALTTWSADGGLAGMSRHGAGGDLEGATRRAYGSLLAAARGRTLYRVWNFVPAINAQGPGGLENYRAFCRGRSLAFEDAFGPDFQRNLPAASAVGATGPELTVAFVAGPGPARHVENPSQVPSYLYPPEHGPRPPSFARATVVSGHATLDAYISGTSSIRGHSTVAPGDTRAQLECTLQNLRGVSRACGIGEDLARGAQGRHFKVYLRNAEDLGLVAGVMEERVLGSGDRASYLRADICRAELNVEVEVAIRGAQSS
jgi:enamine deaminase RidA (YjgF/YER057c/UK114 family)